MKKRRMLRKFLLMLSSALLLVSLTVGATVAYLTSTDSVTNTFTVGKVNITMDETDVDEYGVAIENAARVEENEYKLLPGHSYTKDPTITVTNGSEPAYIRMIVTVSDIEKLKAAFPYSKYKNFYMGGVETGAFLLEKLVNWDSANWTCNAIDGGKYEFRYNTVVDARNGAQKLAPLFTAITIPGTVNNAELDHLQGVQINAVAHAIQANGFESDVDKAWEAFDAQPPVNGTVVVLPSNPPSDELLDIFK